MFGFHNELGLPLKTGTAKTCFATTNFAKTVVIISTTENLRTLGLNGAYNEAAIREFHTCTSNTV